MSEAAADENSNHGLCGNCIAHSKLFQMFTLLTSRPSPSMVISKLELIAVKLLRWFLAELYPARMFYLLIAMQTVNLL